MKKNFEVILNKHGNFKRIMSAVKDNLEFDGIRNETWMYLSEHESMANKKEIIDNTIPNGELNNYLH